MNPEMVNTVSHVQPEPPRQLTITTHQKITAAFCALFFVVVFWLVMSVIAMAICSMEIHETCPDPGFPLLVQDIEDRLYRPRCCTSNFSACKEPTMAECNTNLLWGEWIVYSLCALVVVGVSWALYTVVVECRRAIDVHTADVDQLVREI
jgi:hypothetical protein